MPTEVPRRCPGTPCEGAPSAPPLQLPAPPLRNGSPDCSQSLFLLAKGSWDRNPDLGVVSCSCHYLLVSRIESVQKPIAVGDLYADRSPNPCIEGKQFYWTQPRFSFTHKWSSVGWFSETALPTTASPVHAKGVVPSGTRSHS